MEKTGGGSQKLILAAMIFASLGLAVLGTVLILQNKSNLESTLGEEGIPKSQADQIAESLSESGGGESSAFAEGAGAGAQKIFSAVQYDFALSSRTVFYGMAAAMAVAFLVALIWMPAGKAPDLDAAESAAESPPAA